MQPAPWGRGAEEYGRAFCLKIPKNREPGQVWDAIFFKMEGISTDGTNFGLHNLQDAGEWRLGVNHSFSWPHLGFVFHT